MSKNPDQGSFLLPGIAGYEHIPEGGTSFTAMPFQTGKLPVDALPNVTDITERSEQMDRLLAYMGVMAGALPAVEAEDDKAVEFGLRQSWGDEYEEKVAEKREIYALHQSLFDHLFAKMWDLETVKINDERPEAEVIADFEADKAEFAAEFMKSEKFDTDQAKNNRATYRHKLDRQQMSYQEADVGTWPNNAHRDKRIATMKRRNERARQKRRAAFVAKFNT